MNFNEDPTVSCSQLSLYDGEMTLMPHQGDSLSGVGSVELACGAATRHLRIRFQQTDGKPNSSLPSSADLRYGRGTSFMRLPGSEPFFLFVTSGFGDHELVGESKAIQGDGNRECDHFEVYLINCLIPGTDMPLSFGSWLVSLVRTACAYDLTRVSLPTLELNLTHKLTVSRKDHRSFRWTHIAVDLERLLLFLSFANRSRISAPVVYGYRGGEIRFFRFETPRRSVPTNRRSWATNVSQNDLGAALTHFLKTVENDFWGNILQRAIEWQILAEASLEDSAEQALFTVQMLLELLSFVLLVEDAAILGEDGYSKLPASDRITLLCSRSNQEVLVQYAHRKELEVFCGTNSISNVGELITALRNKLIHPTKKNRQYLDQVPNGVRHAAVYLGLQVASLTMLKVIEYRGTYYDIIGGDAKVVPWVQ